MDFINLTGGDKTKAKAPAKPKRPPIDWERIESEYRAGQLSVSEIASTFGITRGAIQNKAARRKWTRNLAGRIRERVAAKIVAPDVARHQEEAIVEAMSERGAAVVRLHQERAGRLQGIVNKIAARLEADDELPVLAASQATGNLSNALKTLTAIERQAFNLDAATAPEGADLRTVEIVIVDP
jgi:phosphoribosylanthranilate isomerase